jgi:LmbE family N-acetylglucosaminyl deacetylase
VTVPERFPGTVAIVAPHQDDETLGCGGHSALLADKRPVHVVFVTDGSRSPVPGGAPSDPALVAIREDEARTALGILGVPAPNLQFLRLPDGRLDRNDREHGTRLANLLQRLAPSTVLVPFRLDWHPDHMACHRMVAEAHAAGRIPGALVEYFVYTQRRLLPGGDVRSCLDPRYTWQVDISSVAKAKREALECYRSQVTRFFDWQHRPILSDDVLRRACGGPEVFLPSAPRLPTRAFIPSAWLTAATRIEPSLKRMKDAAFGRIARR